MENRSTAKDIRMKDAEKLMAYLSSLPEETWRCGKGILLLCAGCSGSRDEERRAESWVKRKSIIR